MTIQIINIIIKGTYHVIKLIRHSWFRSSRPFCSPFEIFLYQFTICPILEKTRSPCHGGFYDLVSNSEENVPGHCSIQTGWFKVRGFIFLNWKTESLSIEIDCLFIFLYRTWSDYPFNLYIGTAYISRKFFWLLNLTIWVFNGLQVNKGGGLYREFTKSLIFLDFDDALKNPFRYVHLFLLHTLL